MKLLAIIFAALFLFSQQTEAALSQAYLKKKLDTWISSNIVKPNIPGPGGMEVNSFTGNLFYQRCDVSIPGRGLDIEVCFSYNSGATKNDWGYGKGWTSNFNMEYQRSSGFVTIRCEDGRKDKFTESSGSYSPPAGVFNTLSEYAPGKFLLQTKFGMQYFFDDSTHKKLTKIQDPHGNTVTFTGYSAGHPRPQLITDANGRSIRLGWAWTGSDEHLTYIIDSIASPPRTTSYLYDTRGNLKRVTDPLGNICLYQYDARSRLIGFTDELSNTVALAFNDSGAVTSITTPGSSAAPPTSLSIVYSPPSHKTIANRLVAGALQATTYTFDLSGRVVHIVGMSDVQYEYDAQNNVTRTINSNGNGTDHTYDGRGNHLSETDALSHTASWTYEPVFNQVVSATDKRGSTTTFSYDTHGNLLSVSRPPGFTESMSYDAFGNMVSCTDGRGNTTICSYDANGNLAGITHPIGSESFSYDNSGNCVSWTDENGHATTYAYDKLDRRISMTNAIGGSRIYLFGGRSNLIQETDENGHSTSYTYDALHQLVGVTRPEGTATFSRDAYGNVIQCADFRGNMTSYTYDTKNRLVGVTDALGHSCSFTYDNNGNTLSSTDFNGNLTTHQYDAVDRLTRTTDLYGHDVLLIYDQNDNVTSITDQNGHVTTCTYDVLDRLLQEVYPIGSRSFAYDNNGNLLSNTDPNGHTVTCSYDANNRLTTMLDPLLHTMSMTYDPAGNVVSMTNPNGLTSAFAYDALHRMVASVNPMSEATTCTYDAVGNRITCTLPHGNGLSYTYDASNRMTSVSDAIGLVASHTYDANSNMLTEADGNSNTTQYTYDALNRLTSTIAPLGQSTLCAYDNNSNVVSTTDATGGTTTYTYDGLNRQMSTTFPGGLTTTCSYDAVGNPSSILDGRGNTTSFSRDVMDRLTQISYANGSHRQCTYDPAGNVLSLQDQNANTISYTYDAMDRMTHRDFPDGSSHVYAYDNAGRLTSAISSGADVTFTYDGADRVLSEVLNGKMTSYSYNIAGRMMTTTYPGGRVVTNVMNPRLQTSSRRNGAITLADFTYDAASRMTSQTNANGSSASYFYNDNDWMTSLSHNRGPVQLAKFNYAFDNRGYRTSVEKLHRPDNSEKYQYDATTRLTGYREGILVGGNIPAPLTQTQFTFDAIGNRTNSTKDGVPTTYVANAINAYTSITGGISLTPSYDANGNMISDGARVFTYDYMDQLTGVLDVATNAVYTYDALGRRIQKVVNGITDRYLLGLREYDPAREYQVGDAVIEERDGADVVTATYVQDEDGPVSMTKYGSATQNYYFHQNSLGSMVAMTDDSGRVVERYEYDSFGKVSIYDSVYTPRAVSAIGNVYMFGGMEYEAGTGLYIGSQEVFNKGRAYNPQIGRFMQQDPTSIMGNPPDLLNGYSFVANNPTNCKSTEVCGNGYCRKNGYVVAADYNYKAQSYRFASGPRQTTSQDGTFSHKLFSVTGQPTPVGESTNEGGTWKLSRDVLKSYFETGDVPTQQQFYDLIWSPRSNLSDDGGGIGGDLGRHTKSGHVTLLKRNDDGSASGRHTKSGHVTLLKRGDGGAAERKGWDGTIKGNYASVRDFNPVDMVRLQSRDACNNKILIGGEKTVVLQRDYCVQYRESDWDFVAGRAGPKTPQVSRSNIANNRVISLNGLPPGVPWEVPPGMAAQRTKSRSNIQNNRVIPLWGLPPGVPFEAAYSSGKKEFKGHVTLLK